MSNTNELPKEIYVESFTLEKSKPHVICMSVMITNTPKAFHKPIPYIRKDIHESEMNKCWKSGNENYELLMCRKNAHIEYLKSELERVKGEMQKEIDLLKSGTHTFVVDNIFYAQKTCDCKLILGGTATFLCHGQCKY